MAKNILFIIGALVLIIVLWWLYQLVGEWLFLFFFVVAIISLISNIEKPKFGHNKKDK